MINICPEVCFYIDQDRFKSGFCHKGHKDNTKGAK